MRLLTSTQVFQGLALTTLLIAPCVANAQNPSFGETSPNKRWNANVTAGVGYDDNVYTSSTNTEESFFSTLAADVDVTLGNTAYTLAIGLSGSVNVYDRPGKDVDYTAGISVNFNRELNERFRLFADAYASYQVEPDNGTLFSSNRRSGNYFYSNLTIGLETQITNRLSVVSTAYFGSVNYTDSVIGDFSDRIEYGSGTAFRYALQPDTSLVLEYRARFTDFSDYTYANGRIASRDSFSQFILAGVDYSITERTDLSLRLGAEIRDSDLGGTSTNPYFEGTYTVKLAHMAGLTLLGRVGYEESDVFGTNERYAYRFGATYSFFITPKLKTGLTAFYQHNDYKDNNDKTSANYDASFQSFQEDVIDLGVNMTYAFTRNWAITGSYNFSTISSDVSSREYDRNRMSLGVKFAF